MSNEMVVSRFSKGIFANSSNFPLKNIGSLEVISKSVFI